MQRLGFAILLTFALIGGARQCDGIVKSAPKTPEVATDPIGPNQCYLRSVSANFVDETAKMTLSCNCKQLEVFVKQHNATLADACNRLVVTKY